MGGGVLLQHQKISSTFCQVWIGANSSMTGMVTMTVSVVVPSVTKTSFFSALSYLWHCREPNEGHREPHRRKRWRYVITFAVTVPLTVFSTSASTRYKKTATQKYLILSPTLACHLCSHPSNCQYVNRMSTNSPGCRDPRHPRKRIDLRHAFTDHTLNIE